MSEQADECVITACGSAVKARGLCSSHYTVWRSEHAKECSVDGCERSVLARDWCPTHYSRWWKHGDPGGSALRQPKEHDFTNPKRCSACGEVKPAKAFSETRSRPDGPLKLHSSCRSCHNARRKERSAVAYRAEQGLPPDAVLPRLTGPVTRTLNAKGYVVLRGMAGHPFEHTVVMAAKLGRSLLPHENVHHLNGDRQDNRPENLELWSRAQPPGQRVSDKVAWCIEFLRAEHPEALSEQCA